MAHQGSFLAAFLTNALNYGREILSLQVYFCTRQNARMGSLDQKHSLISATLAAVDLAVDKRDFQTSWQGIR